MMRIDPGLGNDMNLRSLFDLGALIVDVRTEREYAGYHVKGAMNIPYERLEAYLRYLKAFHRTIIVYSTYGRRSQLAAKLLDRLGLPVVNGHTLEAVRTKLNLS